MISAFLGANTFTWWLSDDRWLDWLDSKIALLINRDGVDPRDYGGKSYDEYVDLCSSLPRISSDYHFAGN